jgi:hypothetical protein
LTSNQGTGPARLAESPLPAVLSTWDVLSWIAFRELRPRPDNPKVVDFALTWGHSSASQILEALDARGSAAPYCIWEPLILDGEPWDGHSFKHVAWSPNGPKMLRWIVSRVGARQGRAVSFQAAGGILREKIEALQRYSAQIGRARPDLMETLRAGTLTAWGKRDARRGEPNPAAQYEAVVASVFLDELVSLTEWDTIGPESEHPTAIFTYRGPTFREVRFYAADVLQVWPERKVGEAKVVATIASERKLVDWLTKLMRTNPKSPMSKAATKRAATATGLHFSERAFSRAWAGAVQDSGSTSWSVPGPKS